MVAIVSRGEWATENEPPFFDGQRLSQPEFHRIYKEYPGDKKIELIFGSVYIQMVKKAIASPYARIVVNESHIV